jgi:diaminohydroxyphosphoribosylaminopyrimidine deaminase/5-amino-6-(5-phosphoribosylamino)uracil reductase
LIFNTKQNDKTQSVEFVKIGSENFLEFLLRYLYQINVLSVLVEGGAYTHQQFIDHNYFDEIIIIESNQILNEGVKAPSFESNTDRFKSEKFSLNDDYIQVYTKI